MVVNMIGGVIGIPGVPLDSHDRSLSFFPTCEDAKKGGGVFGKLIGEHGVSFLRKVGLSNQIGLGFFWWNTFYEDSFSKDEVTLSRFGFWFLSIMESFSWMIWGIQF